MNPKAVQQVNRNLDMLAIIIIAGAVKALKPPWNVNAMGRPAHRPEIVAFACILRIFSNRTYEGTEAYMKTIEERVARLFHVNRLPGHSVIHRGMEKLSILYIRKLMAYIILEYRKRGMEVAVDSSGFGTNNSSKWFDIRIQRKISKREYLKLHIVVDIETGIIHNFTITHGTRNDSPEFERLLRCLPQINKAFGDKAYSSRKNCEIVSGKHGIPYLCFKKNSTGRAARSLAWKRAYREYTENTEKWMKEYHKREIVEAVFSSIKRRWGERILSRKPWRIRREIALKVLVYNVKQVLYCQRAKELGEDLWIPAE